MTHANDGDGVQRIFLMGAGNIGAAHAEACRKLPGTVELHVTDTDPAKRVAFRDRFVQSGLKVALYDSVKELLAPAARPTDIAVVATPPKWHAPLTVAALRSGRHVVSEKPLAMSLDEAREMYEESLKAGRLLGCCSSRFLGSASAEAAKRAVRGGALGRVYHVTWAHREARSRTGIEYQPSTPWFVSRAYNGGGCLMDWGPYDISSLCDLLRPREVVVRAAWVSSPKTKLSLPEGLVYDIETHVSAWLEFVTADGVVPVRYERASCTHGHAVKCNEVEGIDGALTWDWTPWTGTPPLRVSKDRDGKLVTEEVPTGAEDGLTPHERPLVFMYRAIRDRPHHGVHGADALFSFSVLCAIYAGAETGTPQTVRRV